MLGAFDYRDGYGNCPPGMYRPAPMYDCRPNVSGQVIYQQDLAKIAAQYVDDGSTTGQTTAGPASSTPYQAPAFVAPVQVSGGGSDNTMLLIFGALALFLVMKK